MTRRAGVLLHPSSLPGPFGVGNLGPASRDWMRWMDGAGLRVWQMLPLLVVDEVGCPYASPSAMAREPSLISPEDLVADGWLRSAELPPHEPVGDVDWARQQQPRPWLEISGDRVAGAVDLARYTAEHPWLEDWATFDVLSRLHGERWWRWPEALRDREPDALAEVRTRHGEAWNRSVAAQWLFDQQWARLREEARRLGIELWGDLPFFVGHASCDVWARRELFRLEPGGDVAVITGAPPDDFMPEGQRWDHPHYADAAHAAEGYRWWRARVRAQLAMADTVRIDHFRGLEAVWEVVKDAGTAAEGRWIPGLGEPLLSAMVAEGQGHALPFVAEDLGVITPEVEALRVRHQLPGMAVMQFGFGQGEDHPYLPANHTEDRVAYIGTHDNPTLRGWWGAMTLEEQAAAARLLGCEPAEGPQELLRALWASPARVAVVTAQDLFGLGPESRMNVPGVKEGNWAWRMREGQASLSLQGQTRSCLLEMNR